MKLYEIAMEFKTLDEFVPEINSELDASAYTVLFDELQGTLANKVHGCVCVIKGAEYEADALRAEAKRLTDKAKVLENKAQRIKDYVLWSMKMAEQESVKTSLFDVKLKLNPESVNVVCESDIPDGFFRLKKEVDKAFIKQTIQNGGLVPGAELVRSEGLAIK